MATARDVLQPLIDTLTCPICYLVLDKPRLLQCGHTYCLRCIQNLCVRIRNDDGNSSDSDDSGDDDLNALQAVSFGFLLIVNYVKSLCCMLKACVPVMQSKVAV